MNPNKFDWRDIKEVFGPTMINNTLRNFSNHLWKHGYLDIVPSEHFWAYRLPATYHDKVKDNLLCRTNHNRLKKNSYPLLWDPFY